MRTYTWTPVEGTDYRYIRAQAKEVVTFKVSDDLFLYIYSV